MDFELASARRATVAHEQSHFDGVHNKNRRQAAYSQHSYGDLENVDEITIEGYVFPLIISI